MFRKTFADETRVVTSGNVTSCHLHMASYEREEKHGMNTDTGTCVRYRWSDSSIVLPLVTTRRKHLRNVMTPHTQMHEQKLRLTVCSETSGTCFTGEVMRLTAESNE